MAKGPEAKIEDYLRNKVKKIGGLCEKFTSPQKRSVPDRICTFDQGIVCFVELKAEGKVPTPAQYADHESRQALGHTVYVLDSKFMVDAFVVLIQDRIDRLFEEEENCDDLV